MTDTWQFWNESIAGKRPNFHADDPHCGFYRMKRREGGFIPVAYYMADGAIHCRVGDQDVTPERGQEIWHWVAGNPVSEQTYRSVAEEGKNWPDMDATVASHIGHNNPPDEAELIQEQIKSASAGISDYATIKDDDHQKRAQTLRSRLLELSRLADNKRVTLVRPHLDDMADINAKWQPLVKGAKADADIIASAMGTYEDAKAAEARKVAEAARIAAEKAASEGKPALVPVLIPVAPAVIRGAAGRAASVKVWREAIVTDWDACFAAFRDRLEVRSVLIKLAQSAVDVGHDVPGVTTEERRRIR